MVSSMTMVIFWSQMFMVPLLLSSLSMVTIDSSTTFVSAADAAEDGSYDDENSPSKRLTLMGSFMSLRSFNLTFIDLSETLEHLSLSGNKLESLDRIELNGMDSLKYIDLTENSMIQLENPLKICCPFNTQNDTSKQLIIINLERNGIFKIKPKNFIQNFRISMSNSFKFTLMNLPIRMIYDTSRHHNLLFTYYPSFIDLDLVNQNSHIFLKRIFHLFRFYQSIQIRLDNHDSIDINCSIVFAMYRKCSIARYLFVGRFVFCWLVVWWGCGWVFGCGWGFFI